MSKTVQAIAVINGMLDWISKDILTAFSRILARRFLHYKALPHSVHRTSSVPSVTARPIKLARNFTCSSVPKWKVSSPTVHFQLSDIPPHFATPDVALAIAAKDVVKRRHGKGYAGIVNALSMTSTATWSMATFRPCRCRGSSW